MATVNIVFDLEGTVYGVYEEFIDAEDRVEELLEQDDSMDSSDFIIEEYELNKDIDG